MATETHPVPVGDALLGGAKEYREGAAQRNRLKVREAAEKVWRAVTQATDASIYGATGARVEFNSERLEALEEMGRGDLAGRVAEIAQLVHGDCFYHGYCTNVDVRMEEACQLVQDITGDSSYRETFRSALRGDA